MFQLRQRLLGILIALVRGFVQPEESLLFVLRDVPPPLVIQDAEVAFGLRVPLLCGLIQPAHSLLIILNEANEAEMRVFTDDFLGIRIALIGGFAQPFARCIEFLLRNVELSQVELAGAISGLSRSA